MKRYAASAVLHGMAIWGRPCLATVPRALQRTTQQSIDTIDKLFMVTLKAILGLNRKSCELAIWREFGWMGMAPAAVTAKLSLSYGGRASWEAHNYREF